MCSKKQQPNGWRERVHKLPKSPKPGTVYPYTPLEKLIKNLKNIKDSKQKKAVLIATGSFNPVHKMHINMFEIAKKYLENEHNYKVIAGFVSPSHDLYVKKKTERAKTWKPWISSYDRIRLFCVEQI